MRSAAHLTESSPLVTTDNAAQLWKTWSCFWDMDRPLLLEKSPPNLVMGRFLQALFPGSAFVVVIRHPVVVTLSTKKWAPRTRLHNLMQHWFTAHRIFRGDLARLDRVTLVRYEDLITDPVTQLGQIQVALGLDGAIPTELIQTSRSVAYEQAWDDMARGGLLARRTRAALERKFASEAADYGYSLSDLNVLESLPALVDLEL
jgi:hypothetical protein